MSEYVNDSDHAALKAEWHQAFDALRAAGLEHDADHPIAARYRAASDAVNHANRAREHGRAAIRVEVLHWRDPDSECTFTVFVNGVPLEDTNTVFELVDIDPGRGYDRATWNENRQADAANPALSDAFRAAVLDAYDHADDSPHIREKW